MTVSDKAAVARLEIELAQSQSELYAAQLKIADLEKDGGPKQRALQDKIDDLEADLDDAYRRIYNLESRDGRMDLHHTDVVDESLYLLTKLEQTLRRKLPPS